MVDKNIEAVEMGQKEGCMVGLKSNIPHAEQSGLALPRISPL